MQRPEGVLIQCPHGDSIHSPTAIFADARSSNVDTEAPGTICRFWRLLTTHCQTKSRLEHGGEKKAKHYLRHTVFLERALSCPPIPPPT